MTGNKMVCPHCGHDGTPETSKPPLGSYGFNYLAEGIVCREIRGSDPTGRLLLSGDFKCEGSQSANARIECRSCWRTFGVPEGLSLAALPEAKGQSPEPVRAEAASGAGVGAEAAAEAISRNLLTILRASVEESGRSGAARMSSLEAELAGTGRTVEGLLPLTEEVAALRERSEGLLQAQEQTGQRVSVQAQALASLTDEQGRQREEAAARETAAAQRLETLEAGLAELRESVKKLAETFAQVEDAQQTGRLRLDAQADVLRALHAAAQEQISRREELRAAVQKLEELAAGLDEVKPLPNSL